MTGGGNGCLVGRELLVAAAAEEARWPSTSTSRARQVTCVAGEHGRALERPEYPAGEDATAGEWFLSEHVKGYLRLAGTGALRLRAARGPGRKSDHSAKIWLQALRLLMRALGVEDMGDLPPQPDPADKEPVAARPRVLLREQLRQLADVPGATPGRKLGPFAEGHRLLSVGREAGAASGARLIICP